MGEGAERGKGITRRENTACFFFIVFVFQKGSSPQAYPTGPPSPSQKKTVSQLIIQNTTSDYSLPRSLKTPLTILPLCIRPLSQHTNFIIAMSEFLSIPLPFSPPSLFLRTCNFPLIFLPPPPHPLLPPFSPHPPLPLQPLRLPPRPLLIPFLNNPRPTQYLPSKSAILSPRGDFFVRGADDGCRWSGVSSYSCARERESPAQRSCKQNTQNVHMRSSSICRTSRNDPTPPFTLTTVPISTPLRSTARPVAEIPLASLPGSLNSAALSATDVVCAFRVVGAGAGRPHVISIVAPLLSSRRAIQRVG